MQTMKVVENCELTYPQYRMFCSKLTEVPSMSRFGFIVDYDKTVDIFTVKVYEQSDLRIHDMLLASKREA